MKTGAILISDITAMFFLVKVEMPFQDECLYLNGK
jgi:hypothetical protein